MYYVLTDCGNLGVTTPKDEVTLVSPEDVSFTFSTQSELIHFLEGWSWYQPNEKTTVDYIQTHLPNLKDNELCALDKLTLNYGGCCRLFIYRTDVPRNELKLSRKDVLLMFR